MENNVPKVWCLLLVVAILTALFVAGCQTTTEVNKVVTPVITPPGGVYDQPQTVSITCATADAEIRYTLNNTEPTEKSLLYTEPFTVELGTIVKAKAFKSGYEDSEISTEHYGSHYPVIIGSCYIEGGADKVVVLGDFAYVIGSYEGLTIVNVANKRNAFVVGQYSLREKPEFIAVSNNTVFVTYAFWLPVGVRRTNLVAIDVTNPHAPQALDVISVESECATFTVKDGYAYLIGEYLKVIDVSDPSNLREVGSFIAYAFGAKAITVSNDIAYAAMDSEVFAGVSAYNVSDPSNPYSLDTIEIYSATDIESKGSYVYVSAGMRGLHTVDASIPSQMRYVSRYGTSRYLTEYCDFIFTINGNWDLSILDTANPMQPEVVCNVDIPEEYACMADLAVVDDYLYAVDQEMGLLIMDVGMLDDNKLIAPKSQPVSRNMIK